jgi:hypothetical protein
MVRQVTLGSDGAPHRVSWQRNGQAPQTVQARWVIDACGRAGMLKRQLGLALDNDHAGARGVVPHALPHRHRQLERRPRLARTLRHAHALAVDQPPGRRGLLGVADPAVVGLAFGGHRGRPGLPPERVHGQLRQGDGLAARIPAAAVRRPGPASATSCRTSPSSAASRTTAARSSRTTAGPWPARPGASWTRSIRRAATSSPSATPTSPNWWRWTCRQAHQRPHADLRADLPVVLRQHDGAVPGPVRPVRRPGGAADEDHLGLHLLLERAGAAVLPGAADRRGLAGAPDRCAKAASTAPDRQTGRRVPRFFRPFRATAPQFATYPADETEEPGPSTAMGAGALCLRPPP